MNTENTGRPFSICIYCGSKKGTDPRFKRDAADLGQRIAEKGWRLVYGGGHAGLMGIIADSALKAGGIVVGVIPERLVRMEVAHNGLTELHTVQTMHDRKQKMAELSDAFVALPGGIGTLEELFEVWTWRHLGYHQRPVALLNSGGFYSPLLSFMSSCEQSGFIEGAQLQMLSVCASIDQLISMLAQLKHPCLGAEAPDYSDI